MKYKIFDRLLESIYNCKLLVVLKLLNDFFWKFIGLIGHLLSLFFSSNKVINNNNNKGNKGKDVLS